MKFYKLGWIHSENVHTMKRKERKNKLSYIALPFLERLHYNSKIRLISARHTGSPIKLRTGPIGIQLRNIIKRPWIPGQARNDKMAGTDVLLIKTKSSTAGD